MPVVLGEKIDKTDNRVMKMKSASNVALIAVLTAAEEYKFDVYYRPSQGLWSAWVIGYNGNNYGEGTLEQVLRKAEKGLREYFGNLSSLARSFPVTLIEKPDEVKFVTWLISKSLRFDFYELDNICIYWQACNRSTSYPKDHVAAKLYTQWKEELERLNGILTAIDSIISQYFPEEV